MKFRLNLLASYIAGRFNVSKNTVRRVFDSLIPVLAGKLKSLIKWPSKKSLKKNCPQIFKNSDFSKTVLLIALRWPFKGQAIKWPVLRHGHHIKIIIQLNFLLPPHQVATFLLCLMFGVGEHQISISNKRQLTKKQVYS